MLTFAVETKLKFIMCHACQIGIKPGMLMHDLIEENPLLLLMLQHFEIDFQVGEFTVEQLCNEKGINLKLFLAVANLYNGFKPKENPIGSADDLKQIIDFLRNSHKYYREDKYPQIRSYIKQLQENHPERELRMLEKFFNDYFVEVIEHLDYEDNVAFPYFIALIGSPDKDSCEEKTYSAKEYSVHHTDIELKIKDLKSLLLNYVTINNDLSLRRKLFFALFELEYDLYIHSLIEETILIPFGYQIERV